MVVEPLAYYDEKGNMVPALAAEIPTVENGGVAADLTSITWTLKQGVVVVSMTTLMGRLCPPEHINKHQLSLKKDQALDACRNNGLEQPSNP